VKNGKLHKLSPGRSSAAVFLVLDFIKQAEGWGVLSLNTQINVWRTTSKPWKGESKLKREFHSRRASFIKPLLAE
jgi:hypothetical protein